MALATLSFDLAADASGFNASMKQAEAGLQGVEKAAKRAAEEMKKGFEGIRNVATGVAAVLGGVLVKAIGEASKESEEMKQAQAGVNKVFKEMGDVLLPPIISALQTITGAWNSLSSEQKAFVAHALAAGSAIATLTAGVASLAIMLPKLKAAFGVFRAIVPIIGGALLPLLAIAGIVAGMILIIGALKKAWDANLGGIQEKTASVFEAIRGFFSSIPGWVETAVKFWVEAFFGAAQKIRNVVNDILKGLGVEARIPEIPAPKVFFDAVKFELTRAASAAVETGLQVFADIKDTFKTGLGVVKDFIGSIGDAGSATQSFGKSFGKSVGSINKAIHDQIKEVVAASHSIAKLDDTSDTLAEKWSRGFENMFDAEVAFTAAPLEVVDQEFLDMRENMVAANGAVSTFANSVIQAIPRLNQLVSAAQQGAQTGGVWGALIAVLVQLISETKGFQQVLDIVNGDLDQLIAGIEPLVAGILKVMEALDPISNVITDLVGSALRPIGAILTIIAPLLKALTTPLVAVVDLFSKLVGAIGDFFESIQNAISGKGFKPNRALAPEQQRTDIAQTAKDEFAKGQGAAFLAQIEAAERALKAAEAETLHALRTKNLTDEERATLFKAEADAAANLHRLQEEATRAEAKFVKAFVDAADPAERRRQLFKGRDALEQFTDATVAATEALTNIPAGYKLAMARFEALAPEGSDIADAVAHAVGATGRLSPSAGLGDIPHFAHGGIVSGPTLAMIGEAGPEAVVPLGGGGGGGMGMTVIIENLTIAAADPASFWKQLRSELQRETFLRTGASIAGAPQWVGG